MKTAAVLFVAAMLMACCVEASGSVPTFVWGSKGMLSEQAQEQEDVQESSHEEVVDMVGSLVNGQEAQGNSALRDIVSSEAQPQVVVVFVHPGLREDEAARYGGAHAEDEASTSSLEALKKAVSAKSQARVVSHTRVFSDAQELESRLRMLAAHVVDTSDNQQELPTQKLASSKGTQLVLVPLRAEASLKERHEQLKAADTQMASVLRSLEQAKLSHVAVLTSAQANQPNLQLNFAEQVLAHGRQLMEVRLGDADGNTTTPDNVVYDTYFPAFVIQGYMAVFPILLFSCMGVCYTCYVQGPKTFLSLEEDD